MRRGGGSCRFGSGVVVLWLAAASLVAAGCSSEALRPGGQGTGGAPGVLGGYDAGAGGAASAGDAAASLGPVSGSFETPGAVATISFPGGGGYLEESPDGTFDFLLSMPALSPGAEVTFTAPPGAFLSQFALALNLGPAATSGVYQSNDGCGIVGVTFYVPSTVDASCGPLTDAGVCPADCALKTALIAGDSPCYIPDPAFLYQATGAAACSLDTPAAVGSWVLSLTALVATTEVRDQVGAGAAYLAHGTLTAALIGGPKSGNDGGNDGDLSSPGKLWLQF